MSGRNKIPQGAIEVGEINISPDPSRSLLICRGNSLWLNEKRGEDHVALFVEKMFVKNDDAWVVGCVFKDGAEVLRAIWPHDEDEEVKQQTNPGHTDDHECPEWVPDADRDSYNKLSEILMYLGGAELVATSDRRTAHLDELLDAANVEVFDDSIAERRPFRHTTWFYRFLVNLSTRELRFAIASQEITRCTECGKFYDHQMDLMHYCPACKIWLHANCLQDSPGESAIVPSWSVQFGKSATRTNLARAPIVRGQGLPDDWRVVGNGIMTKVVRNLMRTTQSKRLPRDTRLAQLIGESMLRKDDWDVNAHTARRQKELGNNYISFVKQHIGQGLLKFKTCRCGKTI
ncbi:hypothetical protein VKT23_020266 [Stygiomarasmius scandens]|uniref:BAH domain-containing protein n=1 Tax=Marasmiellus scandens TaxID=2682957 RepID=A0ABR1IMZ5_9AGAR